MRAKRFVHIISAAVLAAVSLRAGPDDSKRTSEVQERLRHAEAALREVMGTPDGIPQDLLEKAHCAVIVPGLKQGAFVVGAKYGRGFITCRNSRDRGWSAPGNIKVEGGSVGLQIGGGEVDLFLLVMNQEGEKGILNSEFKLGGEASVMAGPVGRSAQANTDAYMRAKMLAWSRSRGVFAGVALEGTTLRESDDDNRALYGRELSNEAIVRRHEVTAPPAAQGLLQMLSKYSPHEVH